MHQYARKFRVQPRGVPWRPFMCKTYHQFMGVSLNYLESRSGIRALNFLWTADERHHHHRQTQPVIAIGSRMDGFEPQKWHNLPFVVCQKLCRTPPLWSKMIKWYQINTTTDMINHVCKFWICLDQPIFGSMAVHDSPWQSRPSISKPWSCPSHCRWPQAGWQWPWRAVGQEDLVHYRLRLVILKSEPGLFIFAIHRSELCRHRLLSTSAVAFETKLGLHIRVVCCSHTGGC